jgi:hypothetical protein
MTYKIYLSKAISSSWSSLSDEEKSKIISHESARARARFLRDKLPGAKIVLQILSNNGNEKFVDSLVVSKVVSK